MYRKAFLAMSFLAFILIIIIVAYPTTEEKPLTQSKEEVLNQIRDFNASSSAIMSISCEVSAMGSKTEVIYMKPSKVLAITSSPFGRKQAEVATDGKDYWFWLKDFDKTSIYHCPLSMISSTRVILPMRPNLITSALGVDEIRWDSISIHEGTAQMKCSEDDLVKCVTFKEGRIEEITYLRQYRPVMTATFKSHQNIDGFEVPKELNVFWHEENASLNFEMKNVVLNFSKPPEIKMPQGMNKISLIGL
jgi:hypothetical protein